MSDEIEQLRSGAEAMSEFRHFPAEETVETLRAEIEQLLDKIEWLYQMHLDGIAMLDKAVADCVRLRSALQGCLNVMQGAWGALGDKPDEVRIAKELLRK